MEKINFVNGSTPALNSTNLNKLQDNVEDAIGEVQDNVDNLDTNKLNKSSIKTTKTTSDTDIYSCNYVNEIIEEKYSTNEIKTNKIWINNKPIYTKTFEISLGSDSNISVEHNLSNLGYYWIDESKTYVYDNIESLSANWYYSSSDWARTWVTKTYIRFRSPANLSNKTLYITLQYTKTTD